MRVRVSARIDPHATAKVMDRLVGPAVERATRRGADYAREEITIAGRVDTGLMRAQTMPETRTFGLQARGRIVTRTPYARWQHEGTRTPIVPRRARALRFRPRGAGGWVYARRVRGVQGVPWLNRALSRIRRTDFTA